MANPDDVYDTLIHARFREGAPVFTVQDLADIHNVSRPTMSNYLEEVKKMPGIQKGKIGQAQVFWHDKDSYQSDKELDDEQLIQENRRYSWSKLNESRAGYLDIREDVRARSVSGDDIIQSQMLLIARMNKYLFHGTEWVNWLRAFFEMENSARDWYDDPPDPEETPVDMDRPVYKNTAESDLTDSEIEHYLWDVHLFTTKDGRDVVGLAEYYYVYRNVLKNELKDEYSKIKSFSEIERADVSHLLPPPRQLISAGDAVDELITGYYGINW